MHVEDSTVGVFALAAIFLKIQTLACLAYGSLDEEEHSRFTNLNQFASAFCEFFILMYLLVVCPALRVQLLLPRSEPHTIPSQFLQKHTMYIQDKFVYKLLTISLVLNFILLVLTMQVCRWYPIKALHNYLSRLSGYLTILVIYAEFSEELVEKECMS